MRTVSLSFDGVQSNYTLFEDGSVYNKQKQKFLKGTSVTKQNRYVKVHVDKFRPLHRLVAEAFIPNPYNLPQVNHIDGNRLNNAAINLEWVSPSTNVRHAYSTGLKHNRGETNPISILTEKNVRDIRAAHGTARQIRDALKLPVSIACVKSVRNGKTWNHVV
ncbi:HNH endonuclease [Pectobacterium phage Khlen]|uniref:HNH homing endonuclease n=12 Tax=Phimunavirus TaxID=2560202 RepID=A0A3G8FJT9_9CAUD|nr:HNH endonuclease [Pectobacterium phage PP90]YP_009817115.1 HNH endonuclease [Pectobacterium phage Clickz]YP_009817166.1 HNH endonuclease [Pectobacterium phage Khlen]YP_009817271.1 HNH endonuclease [Pectobacterium phage Phoria]YP_009817368.1 HNH endonuclease [Pectobacterium phage Zenivior]AZF94135.1 HNH homing endonuclease [Pectobacterium phage Clickz_B2]AZF94171.1 HNH homing endonuclease [Pectobacterium phage Clickz_B3]AZF94259.1 HNH homing endonuclease [Pectobacterium phage Clickz_B4]AZ